MWCLTEPAALPGLELSSQHPLAGQLTPPVTAAPRDLIPSLASKGVHTHTHVFLSKCVQMSKEDLFYILSTMPARITVRFCLKNKGGRGTN